MNNAQLLKLKEIKSDEQLAHLYIDGADVVRDKHIEDMWNRLYQGDELDTIFRTNFTAYHRYLTLRTDDIPEAIFDNVSEARAWIASQYGLLMVKPFNPDAFEYDEALAPMRFVGRLRTRLAVNIDEYCYSPTELSAALLTVVNVYRNLAFERIEQLAL